ncbi:iron ABC transporter permease [Dethiosulfatarculus sandiegensis]|uniref:Iron ABC transporter permease n=1 Tax=Dethiosulfatarculus sandiegensis TaxID=1429043 RepID=A0A0D2HR45_9BACT|nr:iron ABC transporter permease [Dethiosulfatarculus sandiegensis]
MILLVILICILLAGCLAASLGIASVGMVEVGQSLLSLIWPQSAPPGGADIVVFDLRLPRVLLALVVGFSLALSGAAAQGVLMNPLVSPFVLGVAPGAALGAALALVLGVGLGDDGGRFLVVANAFFMATLAMFLSYGISMVKRSSKETIILAGVAVGYIFSALVSILEYISREDTLQALVFWLMGSLWEASYQSVVIIGIIAFIAFLVLMRLSWDLNVLSAGQEVAQSLGVRVKGVRLTALLISALTTAAAVSFCGIIGFVGLMAPHMARVLVGTDHRWLLPTAGLLGALMLVVADTLARTLVWPVEIPVGIMTSLVGGPFFIYLLWKRKRDWWS